MSQIKGKINSSNLVPNYAYIRQGAEIKTKLSDCYFNPEIFNRWVDKLCPQPFEITLRGESYEMTRSAPQELSFSYGKLINTDYDIGNHWFQTCFPVVKFEFDED